MSDGGDMSLGLALGAGLVSFLSPCVLPLVPSYLAFVSGMTLDELQASDAPTARRRAILHALLFVLGFSAVFIALGATATALGGALRRWLPLVQQVGGGVIVIFGLFLAGVIRVPTLFRERRMHLARRPAGWAGSFVAGIAFGAGWTPCIGPVLATILLYAGMEATMSRGLLLLTLYSVGLGLPFLVAAVALNWYLAGARRVLRWLRPLQVMAGLLLVVVGVLLMTGRFAAMTGTLAGFGQLINLAP